MGFEEQISEHIFTPHGGYYVYYSSYFFETLAVLKIRDITPINFTFSWEFSVM